MFQSYIGAVLKYLSLFFLTCGQSFSQAYEQVWAFPLSSFARTELYVFYPV